MYNAGKRPVRLLPHLEVPSSMSECLARDLRNQPVSLAYCLIKPQVDDFRSAYDICDLLGPSPFVLVMRLLPLYQVNIAVQVSQSVISGSDSMQTSARSFSLRS